MSSIIDTIKILVIENVSNASYVDVHFEPINCYLVDFLIDQKYMYIDFFINWDSEKWELHDYSRGLKDISERVLELLNKEPDK